MTHQNTSFMISEPARTRRLMSVEGRRSRNRVFEWCSSMMLLGDGVLFAVSPGSISQSSFAPLLDVVSTNAVALVFLLTGAMRIAALWHNGSWPVVGPAIRIVGALIGAVAWFSMGYSLLRQVFEVERAMSPGVIIYFVLCAGEIYSARRAAADVKSRP